MGGVGGEQEQSDGDDDGLCHQCFGNDAVFKVKCCKEPVCNLCLRDFIINKHITHEHACNGLAAGMIIPLLHPDQLGGVTEVDEAYVHVPQYPPWYFHKSVKKNSRLYVFYHNIEDLERGAEPHVIEVIHLVESGGRLSGPILTDHIYNTMRPFSEL